MHGICVHIHEHIYNVIQAKERLLQGEELEESFVAEIVLEKLNSPEIKHYGRWLATLQSHFHCSAIMCETEGNLKEVEFN